MYTLSSLPGLFSNYLSETIIMRIRNEFDSQTVSALPAQTDYFSGVTLSTFELVTEVMLKHVIMKSAQDYNLFSRSHPYSTSVGIT